LSYQEHECQQSKLNDCLNIISIPFFENLKISILKVSILYIVIENYTFNRFIFMNDEGRLPASEMGAKRPESRAQTCTSQNTENCSDTTNSTLKGLVLTTPSLIAYPALVYNYRKSSLRSLGSRSTVRFSPESPVQFFLSICCYFNRVSSISLSALLLSFQLHLVHFSEFLLATLSLVLVLMI
jgi:hypothetical protein